MKFIFMAKFLQRVYNLDKYSKLENDMAPGTEGGGEVRVGFVTIKFTW